MRALPMSHQLRGYEEFHFESFMHAGGQLELVQLWVNLPTRDKITAPHYQAISSKDIPVVDAFLQSTAINLSLVAMKMW